MKKKIIFGMLTIFSSNACFAACTDIANFAKESVILKNKGATKEQQYQINAIASPDDPRAAEALDSIVDGVYTSNMKPNEAYNTYKAICEIANSQN